MMDECEKKRIRMLGHTICLQRTSVERQGKPYCPGGGDGHSFNDSVEYETAHIIKYEYAYSREERKKAKSELRRLTNSFDEETREIARERLSGARKIWWEANRRSVITLTITGIVSGGSVAYMIFR